MTLVKKIKDKKVNFEFNKEYIRVVNEKIQNNDAEFITNSFKEMHPADTADIINLFDSISIESNEKIPLPHEVRQWAVGKILDCADKWEMRFSEVLHILIDNLGKELLKETVRIKQVRDIFGIRAVDEIRNELNIS